MPPFLLPQSITFFRLSLRHWAIKSSLVLASIWLHPSPASAVLVQVGGQSYDLLVASRSYDQEPTLFAFSSMPWFTGNPADPNLAYDFAQAVNVQLGVNTYPGFAAMGGPLFAFATDAMDVYAVFNEIGGSNVQNESQFGLSQVYNYAYINPVSPSGPMPAPGPLPLAAAAMALGWSRQLRSRQRRTRSGSSLSRLGCGGIGRKLGN